MKVKVYSTKTCPHCILVKDFLRDHKVKFEDIDVEEDDKALQKIIKKSGQMNLPVIEIGKKIIIGSNLDAIKKELKLK